MGCLLLYASAIYGLFQIVQVASSFFYAYGPEWENECFLNWGIYNDLMQHNS